MAKEMREYPMKKITITANDTKTRLLVAFLIAESIEFDLKVMHNPVSQALDRLVDNKQVRKGASNPKNWSNPPPKKKKPKKPLSSSSFAYSDTNRVLIAILSTARGANVAGGNGFTAREVMRSCVSLGLRESNAGAGLSKSLHLGLLEHKGKNENGRAEYSLTPQGWELVHKLLPDVPNQPSP
jgi:hypothetical protein